VRMRRMRRKRRMRRLVEKLWRVRQLRLSSWKIALDTC